MHIHAKYWILFVRAFPGCLSDVCAKKFSQLRSKDLQLSKRRRIFTLEISNFSLFMRVDMSHSHHSTSLPCASPPSWLQAWSAASLRVQNASLFALFELSLDACHILSALANSTIPALTENFGLAVKQELCNPGPESVPDKMRCLCWVLSANVISNYRDKSSLRAPNKRNVNTKQKITVATVAQSSSFVVPMENSRYSISLHHP